MIYWFIFLFLTVDPQASNENNENNWSFFNSMFVCFLFFCFFFPTKLPFPEIHLKTVGPNNYTNTYIFNYVESTDIRDLLG